MSVPRRATTTNEPPTRTALRRQLAAFLREDAGRAGDVTSRAMIAPGRRARAVVVARAAGVMTGGEIAPLLASIADRSIRVRLLVRDGERFRRGQAVLRMEGPLRGILLLERTLLNLLGRLCGVATLTGAFVARVRGTRARIRDTRKTTPGLRALEKHAVRCGGATPHRFGLFDAFLAKDNHVAGMAPSRMAREIRRGVESARRRHALRFAMVEADSLAQVEALLRLPAGVVDAILLDNMPLASLRRAVARRDLLAPRVRLEASGGVTLRSVAAIARTGVDFISVGAITHSAPQVDLSLEVRADAAAARRR